MRIFLSAATENYQKQITPIKTIFQVIESSTHVQTNPYPFQFFGNRKATNMINSVDKKIRQAIKKSDLFVAEISIPSFGVGYNICLALYYGLPIICLCHKKFSYNVPSFLKNQSGSQITILFYTFENIEKVTKKALDNAIPKKVRFNMNLTPETSNYLSYLSRKEEKTKTEIIQELIKKRERADSRRKEELGYTF